MELGEHPKCPACSYNLHGLAGDPVRCPECGAKHSRAALAEAAPPPDFATLLSLPLAFVAGMVLWIGVCVVTGKREAWDSFWPWYFGVAVLNALFAFIAPRRFWIWPLVIGFSQFVSGIVRDPGPLWPVGAIAMLFLTTPMFLPAFVGARARRWWTAW